MGLDMYLQRKTYVKRWDHMRDAELFSVSVTQGHEPYPGIDSAKVSYVTEEVGYWRKANAIHGWFVRTLQNGVDECQETLVECAELQTLMEMCQAVLDDPTKAAEILPTEDGFRFGGTGYDEWYMNSLRDTIAIIEPLLTHESPMAEYYYRSSW